MPNSVRDMTQNILFYNVHWKIILKNSQNLEKTQADMFKRAYANVYLKVYTKVFVTDGLKKIKGQIKFH